MNIDRNKLTPMMKQYFEVKDRYPDCILFFRLGDFYEMFFEEGSIRSWNKGGLLGERGKGNFFIQT